MWVERKPKGRDAGGRAVDGDAVEATVIRRASSLPACGPPRVEVIFSTTCQSLLQPLALDTLTRHMYRNRAPYAHLTNFSVTDADEVRG